MKTKLLFLLMFFSLIAHGQNWRSIAEGVSRGTGSVMTGGVGEIFVFKDRLFVSGSFGSVGDALTSASLAFWNGKKWFPVNTNEFQTWRIDEFVIFRDTLYGFGHGHSTFDDAMMHMLRYDESGNSWEVIPNSIIRDKYDVTFSIPPSIFDAIEYNDELYIVGEFTEVDGITCDNIAKWNGAHWLPVLDDNGQQMISENIAAIENYRGDLVIAGKIDSLNEEAYHDFARWNGSKWDNLNGGLIGINEDAPFPNWSGLDLEVYNDQLFASCIGAKTNSNDQGFILFSYNGNQWSGINEFEYNYSGDGLTLVNQMKAFGNYLYLGENYQSNGQLVIGHGSDFLRIEEVLNGSISSFAIYENQLVAGGFFAGEEGPNGVASLGKILSESMPEKSVQIFPNPSSNSFSVSYELSQNSKSVIEVYDMLGKLITQHVYNDLEGAYLRQFNISYLSNGNYMIRVLSKDFDQSQILIVH